MRDEIRLTGSQRQRFFDVSSWWKYRDGASLFGTTFEGKFFVEGYLGYVEEMLKKACREDLWAS